MALVVADTLPPARLRFAIVPLVSSLPTKPMTDVAVDRIYKLLIE